MKIHDFIHKNKDLIVREILYFCSSRGVLTSPYQNVSQLEFAVKTIPYLRKWGEQEGVVFED